jgi:hypothetical protein
MAFVRSMPNQPLRKASDSRGTVTQPAAAYRRPAVPKLILVGNDDHTFAEFEGSSVPRIGETIRCVWGDSVQPIYRVKAVEHRGGHIKGSQHPPAFRQGSVGITVDEGRDE